MPGADGIVAAPPAHNANGPARRQVHWGYFAIQFAVVFIGMQLLMRSRMPPPEPSPNVGPATVSVEPEKSMEAKSAENSEPSLFGMSLPSEMQTQFQAMKDMVNPQPSRVVTANGSIVDLKATLLPAWPPGSPFDVEVYTSPEEDLTVEAARTAQLSSLWFAERGLLLNHHDNNKREYERNWTLPDNLRLNNGSMYLHAFFIHANFQAGADSHGFVAHARFPLITWRWEKIAEEGRSLLERVNSTHERSLLGWRPWSQDKSDAPENDESSGVPDDDDTSEDATVASESIQEADDGEKDGESCSESSCPAPQEKVAEIDKPKRRVVQLLTPELQLQFVPDGIRMKLGQMPPVVTDHLDVLNNQKHYLPLTLFSDFWVVRSGMIEINETVTEVPMKISLGPVGLNKFLLMRQMDFFWSKQIQLGSQVDDDVDTAKETMLETNPYLLALTAIVSIAHTVLEFLAFSSDIKHWRSVKSMEGVSVRSMFWKVGMEIVVFLYLLDNETSFMILFGSGIGVLIEVWKLGKAVRPKNFGQVKLFGVLPWFQLEETESYSKSTTKEYDEQAMKYLSYVLYPLVAGYSVYSLVFEKHKGWYSWVLGSLVGVVYMFGFIMMFPQIFINYKLKSVAHLPMKAFMYKALNTVIDDLFSFIIKMPMMHRLACFRDDVVFAAFLYQRWKYPVDKTRVNEFGQSFSEPKTKKKKVIKKVVKKVVVRKRRGTTEESESRSSSATNSAVSAVTKKDN